MGLKVDGSIVSWGDNTSGQHNVPEPNSDFVAIAAGGAQALGLKSDGSIVQWGYNQYGQDDVPEPNTGFAAIASSIYYNIGLKGELAKPICSPGTSSAKGEETCTPCPAGTAQPDAGSTECLPCPAGTFQPNEGAVVCNACGTGTFQPLSGQIACNACTCDDGNSCTIDACDALDGTCQPVTICQVPAASQWGLLAMALLLCTCGTVLLRRNMCHINGTFN